MMNEIISNFYIKIYDDGEYAGLFEEFESFDSYQANMTYDYAEAMSFGSRQEAQDYIYREIYNVHPLWRLSTRYRLEVVERRTVDWNAIQRNMIESFKENK